MDLGACFSHTSALQRYSFDGLAWPQAASAAGETELDSETHATKEGDELASESMELSQEAEDLLLGQFSIKDTISPQDAHNLAERAGIDGAKVQRFFQVWSEP